VSEPPLISVIVPTRDRPQLAAAVVRAVLAHEGPPTFELIVADQSEGGAARAAASSAAGSDARFLHLPVEGRGRSRALNAGLLRARGRFVVITDDDCLPTAGWLTELERAIESLDARTILLGRVVAGPVAPGKGDPPAIFDEPVPRTFAGRVDRDLIHPNVAIPRELFDEIGAFDERLGVGTDLPGGEDNDFGYRLMRAGWRIAYRPEPTVEHAAWRSVAERAALKRAYGLGQGGFYAKHLKRGDAFIAWRLLRDVARTARAAGGAAVRGRGAEARGHLAYLRGLLEGAGRMAARGSRGRR